MESVKDMINSIMDYENLNDKIINHHFDISVNLFIELNKYVNSKSKDMEIWKNSGNFPEFIKILNVFIIMCCCFIKIDFWIVYINLISYFM